MRCHYLLLFVLLFLAVCQTTGCSGYRAPTIVVGDALLVERTNEGIRLDIPLDLTNPNDESLELLRFTYEASIDGRDVYDGKRAAEATLASGASKRVILPVVVRFDRAGFSPAEAPRDSAWSIRGNLHYVTPGQIAEILLDTGVRKPQTGFSGDGRVELSGAAERTSG